MSQQKNSRLVYTTDPEPAAAAPDPAAPPSAAKQTAKISRERNGRGGKTVTLVSGLRHDPATLERLLLTLKTKCGAGGTVRSGVIEIQGDHRERVAALLAELGYRTVKSGG